MSLRISSRMHGWSSVAVISLEPRSGRSVTSPRRRFMDRSVGIGERHR